MLKNRIRTFFLNNEFIETYENCFEKENVAFVLEEKELLCCLKDSKGYKIQKKFPVRKIKFIARYNDGTIIA